MSMGEVEPVLRDESSAADPTSSTGQRPPLIAFRNITKQFDATLALDDVSLDIMPGEVHALLGQNGAGKSTLIKILAGVYQQDRGTILYGPELLISSTPVSFIHQDLGLIGMTTVAENVALVRGFPRIGSGNRRGLISWKAVEREARRALDIVGGGIPVSAEVHELTRAEQSIVAIARALALDSKVLVLDEPTASLPEADIDRLFRVLGELRATGVGIIYVTHRLDEVERVADKVSVLRDGRLISTTPSCEVSLDQIIVQIVGRRVTRERIEAPDVQARSERTITVSGLRVHESSRPIELSIGAGEIVGAAGLRGAGQEDFGRVLAGIDRPFGGSVVIDGTPIPLGSVTAAFKAGVGFVTSKREDEGLAGILTVRENLFLNQGLHGHRTFLPKLIGKERRRAADLGARFTVRPNSPETFAGALSGGNQQKVLLARVIAVARRLLILEEPTMGVDIGARSDVYAILREAAAQGSSVLVVSSDFEELAQICHRVLVFDKGSLVAEVAYDEISVERLTRLVSGERSIA